MSGVRYSTSSYFDQLFEYQGGLCAWCKDPIEGKGLGKSAVDHNHRCCEKIHYHGTCGRCIRGLVHARCNVTDIKHADWAYENGCYLPSWMLEYVTRGEPEMELRVVRPRSDPRKYDGEEIPVGLSIEVIYPSPEDVIIAAHRDSELRTLYPTLCRHYIDLDKEIEIAKDDGITDRAVRKRIANEKKQLAMRINEDGYLEPLSWVIYPTTSDDDYEDAEPAYDNWPLELEG